MKYIIIYVIISSKGLQIKINIFSMLSPEVKNTRYYVICIMNKTLEDHISEFVVHTL